MYKYVGPGTIAAEVSDLDQVLSCLRDNSSAGPPLGVLFPGGSSACSTLPTLPGSASVMLASCRGGLRKYRFFANSPSEMLSAGAVRRKTLHFPFEQDMLDLAQNSPPRAKMPKKVITV